MVEKTMDRTTYIFCFIKCYGCIQLYLSPILIRSSSSGFENGDVKEQWGPLRNFSLFFSEYCRSWHWLAYLANKCCYVKFDISYDRLFKLLVGAYNSNIHLFPLIRRCIWSTLLDIIKLGVIIIIIIEQDVDVLLTQIGIFIHFLNLIQSFAPLEL